MLGRPPLSWEDPHQSFVHLSLSHSVMVGSHTRSALLRLHLRSHQGQTQSFWSHCKTFFFFFYFRASSIVNLTPSYFMTSSELHQELTLSQFHVRSQSEPHPQWSVSHRQSFAVILRPGQSPILPRFQSWDHVRASASVRLSLSRIIPRPSHSPAHVSLRLGTF